ncbi:MAG: hypothetical protein P4M07_15840 [Xanthobacteraceae bacterium]|nr:hypothetical protein [Xanthobacteraceae bacterium]
MRLKRLIVVAGALAAMACVPAVADATAPKHHHGMHRRHVMHPVAPPARNDGGMTELHRIPSMDPPSCDSPNVISIENCRASSNGRR